MAVAGPKNQETSCAPIHHGMMVNPILARQHGLKVFRRGKIELYTDSCLNCMLPHHSLFELPDVGFLLGQFDSLMQSREFGYVE